VIPTASQTVGPFFNFALTGNRALGAMAREGVEGERIRLTFRVTDGDGRATPGDSMIELWQVDANFRGFGRLETDADGVCVFETVKPASVGMHAPHISVVVFARGLLKHLYTRVYFEGEPANAHDPVLTLVPEERRETLLAKPAWSFDIRLQGDRETVFFDV
jgi:protocatechuate 3,4-dioxygenase, alpha subunit